MSEITFRYVQGNIRGIPASLDLRATRKQPPKGSPVSVQRYEFLPFLVGDAIRVAPQIVLLTIPNARAGKIVYSGELQAHLDRLVEYGVFKLDPRLNYGGDVIFNAGVPPKIWFNNVSTLGLFQRVVEANRDASLVVASNAGNAPLHDWEVNYIREGPLVGAKDFHVAGKPIKDRRYFCVTYHQRRGIAIEYVEFREDGTVKRPEGLEVAVGGRPLVFDGNPSPLVEVLKTSITDPRHVLLLPELKVATADGRTTAHLPLGLRTIQRMISENRIEEIVDSIREGAPLLISLEDEVDCLGDWAFNETALRCALLKFDYPKSRYKFRDGVLYLELGLNAYRHTFWAQKGETIFIGIIRNDLFPSERYQPDLYHRVLKPFGLTIPQLQLFLTEELQVENAVLMGNGKDPRIYVHPQSKGIEEQPIADNDIRDSITAGLIALVV